MPYALYHKGKKIRKVCVILVFLKTSQKWDALQNKNKLNNIGGFFSKILTIKFNDRNLIQTMEVVFLTVILMQTHLILITLTFTHNIRNEILLFLKWWLITCL